MATTINSDWRTTNAGTYGTSAESGPWVLASTGTYTLTEDLTASGIAFLIAASGVVLDFNGHTVTYNNTGAATVTNGDFSTDALGATSITGWTCSGTATVVADTDGPLQYPTGAHFYGSKNLKITVPAAKSGTASLGGSTLSVASTSHGLTTGDYVFLYGFSTTPAIAGVYQVTVTDSGNFTVSGTFSAASGSGTWSKATTLESADVTISDVDCYYAGTLQTADAQSLSTSHSSWMELRQSGAALTPIGTSIDQAFANNVWSDLSSQTRANTTTAICSVTSSSALRLRLYVGNSSTSGSQDVFIGRATLGKAYVPGIIVSGGYELQMPPYDHMTTAMKNAYVSGKSLSAFTVKSSAAGGTLTQGSGNGFRSHAVQGCFAYGAQTVQDLDITVTGDDTCAVLVGHRGTTTGNGGKITIGGSGHGLTVHHGGVNVTRRFNTVTALWIKAALQDSEISYNTVYDCPQIGIQATVATGNSSTQTISHNTIYGRSVVTNAYLIYTYANNTVTDNVLDSVTRTNASGQGLYAGAEANQTYSNCTISNNTIRVTARGNREERTTSPVRAFRLRNQSGGVTATSNAVISSVAVTGNTFEAFTTTGRPTRADGARISLIHRNGSSATDVTFTGNVCRGITGDTGLTACGLNLDGIETGTGITFADNTYDSNHVALWLTSSDSPGLGIAGVDMTGETITKNVDYSGGASMTFQGIHAGDVNNGGISSFRLISPEVGSGASLTPTYQGSASKTIEVDYRITLTVTRMSDNAPISGATVEVLNAAASVDASATTDGSGVAALLLAVATTYSGTTSVTTTNHGPHSFLVQASGYDDATGNLGSLTADQSIPVEFHDLADPPEVSAPGPRFLLTPGRLPPAFVPPRPPVTRVARRGPRRFR